MATLKKIASTTALAASLGAAALGFGAGISAAAPVTDPAIGTDIIVTIGKATPDLEAPPSS